MGTKLNQKNEKRKRIDKESALELLKEYYQGIFTAYHNAIDKFNVEIQQTGLEARVRLWAVLLNAKLIDSFIQQFPDNWTKGKYGRVIFRWEEVQLLIKKLNKNSKPSYIPTMLSDSITNQVQASLFENDDAVIGEPILIFGYTKDKFGQIINPRIVYYNGEVEWIITPDDIISKPIAENNTEDIEVRLKQQDSKKKAE